jgi:hypothetical protein
MPDRFATAVWVNPAAMRQCRTFFALLLVLEVWRGFSAISQSAYATSWTVAMTKGSWRAANSVVWGETARRAVRVLRERDWRNGSTKPNGALS